ncbi:MAG: hypothetical protein QQN41_09750 [Nitrosopumilus sp.]
MMNNSQADINKKIFCWAMTHNFQLIIKFHNEQRRLMKNQVIAINEKLNSCNDHHERKDLLYAKEVYINTFDNLLSINTFLMMYSYLEEFLYHVWKSFGKEQAVSGSGSLKRFKEIIRNVLGLDLNQDREWELLCDYEKVRDCILHANGRVSISKDKNDLDRIIRKSCGHLSKKKDRLELSGEYLDSVSKIMDSLIKRVEKAANA